MAGEIADFAMKPLWGSVKRKGIPRFAITRCQRLTPA